MKEIVDRILKEEQAASRAIEKAKKDAEDIVARARKEAEESVRKTTIDAQDSARCKKTEAEKVFLSEKEKILGQVRAELVSMRQEKEKDIPGISGKVFSQIIDIGG
ncbi:MAG: hypothetical protein WC569_05890 [Candidatus Omnitrophota bacterium]